MSAATAHLVSLIAFTAEIALVLCFVGFRLGVLSLRPERSRRCPYCGERLRAWTCWSCSRSRST
jgi:hypothetical protein